MSNTRTYRPIPIGLTMLIAAAKAGDQAKLAATQARWKANAGDIAALLSRANRHWKRGAVEAMLGEHLRLTTQEAVARLEGDWNADVAAYDRITVTLCTRRTRSPPAS